MSGADDDWPDQEHINSVLKIADRIDTVAARLEVHQRGLPGGDFFHGELRQKESLLQEISDWEQGSLHAAAYKDTKHEAETLLKDIHEKLDRLRMLESTMDLGQLKLFIGKRVLLSWALHFRSIAANMKHMKQRNEIIVNRAL